MGFFEKIRSVGKGGVEREKSKYEQVLRDTHEALARRDQAERNLQETMSISLEDIRREEEEKIAQQLAEAEKRLSQRSGRTSGT